MTITGPDAPSAAPGQGVVDAAMLVLDRMGLTPADLLSAPAARPAAPTFAEYVPVVSALVTDGCRRAYGSYWNRVTEQWGSRGIDEPTPGEIRQLVRGMDPAEDLINVASEVAADFIVIGLRRRSPVGKLILGSNAQRILLDAPCPVLAVKAAE